MNCTRPPSSYILSKHQSHLLSSDVTATDHVLLIGKHQNGTVPHQWVVDDALDARNTYLDDIGRLLPLVLQQLDRRVLCLGNRRRR